MKMGVMKESTPEELFKVLCLAALGRGGAQDLSLGAVRGLLIAYFAAAAAKLLQLCPTLCDPIDSSPRGSPIPGILQARTLEWVAISLFCSRSL